MNPELSILIVHTFEQRLIRQTLRNLRRAVVRVPYEVIIIDNNPGAGIVRMLQREFPEVRYVPMDRNRGFGGAMNAGFAQAKGEYILIFNPDIIVMPGAIEELVHTKKIIQRLVLWGRVWKMPMAHCNILASAFTSCSSPCIAERLSEKRLVENQRYVVF